MLINNGIKLTIEGSEALSALKDLAQTSRAHPGLRHLPEPFSIA